jgi:hypothetical protein
LQQIYNHPPAIPEAVASALPHDALLTRRQLADESARAGFPIAKATLDSMASRGTGPTFRRYGRACLYMWGDFLEWVSSRTTVGASTSAHRAQREAA